MWRDFDSTSLPGTTQILERGGGSDGGGSGGEVGGRGRQRQHGGDL